jgi:hypothetical protein
MLENVMLRAGVGATLAVLGALGATLAGSLTANASPAVEPPADTLTVVSAAASATNPDQLVVVVDSPSTITSLAAEFQISTGADASTQALTQQSSEADPADPAQTQTTWTANLPVGASGLGLGNYVINVSGTFADSATYTVPGAAPFSFDATSAVTLSAVTVTVNPATTTGVEGTVTLTYPDGTADTDYSGVMVNILAAGGGDGPLPVSGNGTFSDPDFAPSANESVSAETLGYGVASSVSVPIALTAPLTPTLSLKVHSVAETYGKTATVTGTLDYTSGSSTVPLSGQKIWIARQVWDQSGQLATATTGSNGSFSITLPAQPGATTLYVGFAPKPYLTSVETTLPVYVAYPTVINNLKVSLSQYWGLSVSGCLGLDSAKQGQKFTSTSGLTVQYASAAKGPWKSLFKIKGNEADAACGADGIKFSGSAGAPENYAYYRVVYAGTTSHTATDSNAVLSWRYDDRITGFKVSPTVVNAGGKLTVRGTLQYYHSGWHNYGGQTIFIDLHPKGSNATWYWIVKVKTNSKGQFSATFKDPISATWEAVFEGNNSNGVGHLSAGSPEVYVRLK